MERIDRRKLQRLLSELSAALNEQRVLQLAVNLTAQILEAPTATGQGLVCAVLLFSQADTGSSIQYVAQAQGFPTPDREITGLMPDGIIKEAISTGHPVLLEDPGQEPGLSRLTALHACAAVACLPLMSEPDPSGVILWGCPVREFFDSECLEILEAVAYQLSISLMNARRFQRLEADNERWLKIRAMERARFARELHDGPTQALSAIALRVNIARRLLSSDPDAAASELSRIEPLARRTTTEIRYLLFTLHPLVLETHGLAAAIESLANKVSGTYDQHVAIEIDEQAISGLEARQQAMLFSIAEEALANARKHAQAPQVWLRLRAPEETLLLEIEDNGVGFNPAAVAASNDPLPRRGIANMHACARLAGGTLHLDTTEGSGTRIQVRISRPGIVAGRIQSR